MQLRNVRDDEVTRDARILETGMLGLPYYLETESTYTAKGRMPEFSVQITKCFSKQSKK